MEGLVNRTYPGQSRPGSDVNEGVLHIPRRSNIIGASPSDCLVSYLGHSLASLTPLLFISDWEDVDYVVFTGNRTLENRLDLIYIEKIDVIVYL